MLLNHQLLFVPPLKQLIYCFHVLQVVPTACNARSHDGITCSHVAINSEFVSLVTSEACTFCKPRQIMAPEHVRFANVNTCHKYAKRLTDRCTYAKKNAFACAKCLCLSQLIKAIKRLEFDEYASAAFEAKEAAEKVQKLVLYSDSCTCDTHWRCHFDPNVSGYSST